MSVLFGLIEKIALLPDWLSLLGAPACLLISAIIARLLRRKKWLPYLACFWGAVGFFLVCCEGESRAAFVWLGLYVLFTLPLLTAIASVRRKRNRASREQKMYEKFHVGLSEEPPKEGERPPKVSCYFEEEEPLQDAEESGLHLAHVLELLEKLRGMNLSAADRLETDVISRHVEGYRRRKLTSEELSTLNDYLATVLRLTAKYSL